MGPLISPFTHNANPPSLITWLQEDQRQDRLQDQCLQWEAAVDKDLSKWIANPRSVMGDIGQVRVHCARCV